MSNRTDFDNVATEWLDYEVDGPPAKRAVLVPRLAKELHNAYVAGQEAEGANLSETLRYATSISLGHDSDEDRRPYVSVARQYGSTLAKLKPWVVYDVTYDAGVDMASKTEFDDQREAIAFGWQQLHRIRRVYGVAP